MSEGSAAGSRSRLWDRLIAGLALALLAGSIPLAQRCARWRVSGHGLRVTAFADAAMQRSVGSGVALHVDEGLLDSEQLARARAVAWTGTLALPERGHLVLRSGGGCRLRVDDETLVGAGAGAGDGGGGGGGGVLVRSGPLPSGLHALSLRCPTGQGARLRWAPPGQRTAEPLPPGWLHPPSSQAVDARASGRWPVEAQAAGVLLLALFGAALLLSRRAVVRLGRQLARQRAARVDAAIFVGLTLLAFSLCAWDLVGRGSIGDEDQLRATGRTLLHNVLYGDWRVGTWPALGAALPSWLAGLSSAFGAGLQGVRMASALAGALGCGLLFVVGRDLLGRRVGVVAGVLYAVMPAALAQGRMAGSGALAALCYLLSVWLFARGQRAGDREGEGAVWGAGLCAGLTLACGAEHATVLLALAAMVVAAEAPRIRAERRLVLPLSVALLPVVAVGCALLIDPRLWRDQLIVLSEALVAAGGEAPISLPSGQRAALHWVAAMPAFVLGAMVLSLLRPRRYSFAALAWLAAPLVGALWARATVTTVFCAVMPACLVAALGIEALAQRSAQLLRRAAVRDPLFAVSAAALGVYVLASAAAVHPHYSVFYGELVGGPAGARRRGLPVGAWGEGLSDVAAYLARRGTEGASVAVRAWGSHLVTLRDDLVRVTGPKADYLIVDGQATDPASGYRLLYAARAGRVPLARLYGLYDGSR